MINRYSSTAYIISPPPKKKEKKKEKKLRISISKFAIRRIKVAGNKTDAREDVAVDTSRY